MSYKIITRRLDPPPSRKEIKQADENLKTHLRKWMSNQQIANFAAQVKAHHGNPDLIIKFTKGKQ